MGCILGLVGTLPPEGAKAIVDRMGESMRHRFPAEVAVCSGEGFAVAAAGEVAGDGQYLVQDESGSVAAVCEGEIYNAAELAAKLGVELPEGSPGTGFHLVPLLYRKFGRDFPRHVNGVFTIALRDGADGSLHLVRDHVGSHSLFWARVGSLVIFATTARALLASGLVPRELDPEGPARYFASKALGAPDAMLRDVRALRASHVTSLGRNGSVAEHDYWRLGEVAVDERTPEEELARRMSELIQDSIRIRYAAGGEIGSLLSGGLDTGVGDRGLDVFSVVFGESFFSDGPLMDIMMDCFPLRGHRAELLPEEFSGIMVDAVQHLDSPVNDNAYVGMYRTLGEAREHGCTVIFEGEGPDEIFPAGNTHGERQMGPLLAIPSGLRRAVFGTLAPTMPLGGSFWSRGMRLLSRAGMSEDERRVTWRTYFHNRNLRRLLRKDWWPSADPYEVQKAHLGTTELTDPLNAYQYGLIKSFLPDDLLYKDERMAAAHGLVNRVPLIDRRLVELALQVPSRFQLEKPSPGKDGIKLLYKKALRGLIPDEIIDRKKERGFSQPTQLWYRNELKDFVHDLLLSRRSLERGILEQSFVRRVFDTHASGKGNIDTALSSIMIFELWMRAWMDREYDEPARADEEAARPRSGDAPHRMPRVGGRLYSKTTSRASVRLKPAPSGPPGSR